MRVRLLSPSDDPALVELDDHQQRLLADLGLEAVIGGMCGDDPELREIVTSTLLSPLIDARDIQYRQAILRDFLAHPDLADELFALALAGVECRKRVRWGFFGRLPSSVLHYSIDLATLLLEQLRALRDFAERTVTVFSAPGLIGFCERVLTELDDDYLNTISGHLQSLSFPGGVVFSARLSERGTPDGLVLHRSLARRRSWRDVLGIPQADTGPVFVYELPERDEAGARDLQELVESGINQVANALAQSTDHLTAFFRQLRWEAGFHVAAVRLHQWLTARGRVTCFPELADPGTLRLSARQLYDSVLTLRGAPVVGSDLNADGHSLVMITGSNQGGKSTFLRALGAAQLMAQSGLFVLAQSFTTSPAAGIFSHYRRPEDETLESGKLEEELVRLDAIVQQVRPGSLVLLNESLACTNEREGSQIGHEVVSALTEAGVRVVYVTHLFHLASMFRRSAPAGVDPLFLVPERLDDGSRTFRIIPGDPLPTSHARDLYRQVFGESLADARGGAATGRPTPASAAQALP